MQGTNPVAYLMWAPFYLCYYLVRALAFLPWWVSALIVLTVTSALAVSTLTEAGPMRIATLARRFSWAGIPLGMITLWWLWCCAFFYVDRTSGTLAAIVSGFMFVALVCLAWFLVEIVLAGKLRRGFVLRGYRRIRLRLRWDSIARSCGMSHERDVRPWRWFLGGVTITRLRARAVQWTPLLWHGRAAEGEDCTQYLIRPARGLTDKDWTDKPDQNSFVARAIAIAVNAEMVSLTPAVNSNGEKLRNWWRLNVFWTDPSNNRPELES